MGYKYTNGGKTWLKNTILCPLSTEMIYKRQKTIHGYICPCSLLMICYIYYREIMPRLNRSQQTFLTFYLLDDHIRNNSSPFSGLTNIFNDIFGGNCTNRGFLHFIYDGYGEYIFENQFYETIERWGAKRICEIIEQAKYFYYKHIDMFYKAKLLKKYSYLRDKISDFEKLNNDYLLIINDESEIIKQYIETHINDFAIIDDGNSQINYIDKEIIEINNENDKLQRAMDIIHGMIDHDPFHNLQRGRNDIDLEENIFDDSIADLQNKIEHVFGV